MPDTAIPPHPDDARSLRDLLHLAVRVFRTQVALGVELGIDRTTVGKYLSGERAQGLEWHVVVAALRGAVRVYPGSAALVVQTVAERWFDLRGTWVPDVDPDGLRELEKESADVTVVQGEVLRLARDGHSEACAAAAHQLVREAVELAAVAGQRVA
jgi:hypothetical protein